MLDYRVRLYRRFPDRPVEQVVFYLTPNPSPLVQQTTFELSHTRHEFRVIRLWEQSAADFLESPGLLPFAVLCHSETDDPAATLRQVAQSIDTLPSRTAQAHVAASSAILAGLKLDQSIIQQILRRDIMRESVMYQSILQEGWEEDHQQGIGQGIQQGIAQGIQQGMEQGVLVGKIVICYCQYNPINAPLQPLPPRQVSPDSFGDDPQAQQNGQNSPKQPAKV